MFAQFSLGPTARQTSEQLAGIWDMTTPALTHLGLEAKQQALEAHSLLHLTARGQTEEDPGGGTMEGLKNICT